MTHSDMRVLVTGVGGFAGAIIIEKLLQKGITVVGTYRSQITSRVQALDENPACEIIQADLTQKIDLPYDIDVIVHAAAQSAPNGKSVADYLDNNVLATQRLVDYATCIKATKIINFSSVSVFGQIRVPVLDETTESINASPYGLSKHLAELILQEVGDEVPSLSLRLPGLVGRTSRGPWLARIQQAVRMNEDIQVFNPDSLFNNAVHIDGLCAFIISLLDRDLPGADAVTLGCSDPMPIYEAVRHLVDIANSSSTVTGVESDASSFLISNEKASQKYSYQPTPLRDVLRTLVEECS